MNVLFVTSECSPFIKTGGLADVMGSLPKEISKFKKFNSSVILPYYKKIKEKNIATYVGYTFFHFNGENRYIGLFKKRIGKVNYYFIDNNDYFYHDYIYGADNDGERFTFFSFAVLECLKFMGKVDVIHANDWHTGLVPFLIKNKYNLDIKTIFTIHNLKYQGNFDKEICSIIGAYNDTLEFNNRINYLKAGILNSDKVTTVSNTYRNETLSKEFGFDLEYVLELRYHDYIGILNGLDRRLFNPLTDKHIPKKYSYRSLSRKQQNKEIFCKEVGLSNDFLVTIVSRLVDQKGLDLLFAAIDDLIEYSNMNFYIMGSGDYSYEQHLEYLHRRYPNRVKIYIGYNEDLAQKIYAAGDCMLVPSKFEPCGLTQLIAMRYGSIPVVRETGGLKDTVDSFDWHNNTGNGFSFKNYHWIELKNAIFFAYKTYNDYPDSWRLLVMNAMKKDFGLSRSARMFKALYS